MRWEQAVKEGKRSPGIVTWEQGRGGEGAADTLSKPGSAGIYHAHRSTLAPACRKPVLSEGGHLGWCQLSCLVYSKCSPIHSFLPL